MRLTIKARLARSYETADGEKPFEDWFIGLKDNRGKMRVTARVERAKLGLFGTYRDLNDGVFELKDDFGPGYRVYFGIHGDEIIILLIGGNKGSQDRDITKAKKYWIDFVSRSKKS
jgi:putative addiction module killer protein